MLDYQLISAVVLGILLLLFLILKLRIQAFLALLISAIAIGLLSGMPPPDVLRSMQEGMGQTLAFVATIVGLGALFGAVLEHSGGAQAIASTLLRRFGMERAPIALVIAGFIIAIPVFFDVAFIILVPIIYALQRRSGKSLLIFGLPLLAGLTITHAFVPPTPGPIAVADILNANLGWVIAMGFIAGIPTAIAGLYFSRKVGRRIFVAIPENIQHHETENTQLPSAALIGGIISLPILLILLNTITTSFGDALPAKAISTLNFIGHPFTALIIANLVAWYVLGIRRGTSKEILSEISLKSLGPAGMIILVTGAGGVLKQILVDTGAGTMLAESMSGIISMPVIFGFIVALIVRVMQGSATVAMITAASLIAPIIEGAYISPASLALVVIAIASGATAFSHFNDSGFWLVNRYFGLNEKQTLASWTLLTGVIGGSGFLMSLLLSLLL